MAGEALERGGTPMMPLARQLNQPGCFPDAPAVWHHPAGDGTPVAAARWTFSGAENMP